MVTAAVGSMGGRLWRSAMWVVVRGNWRGSDFNIIARCLLVFTKAISAICRHRFDGVLACSDVADFQCPMCTLAELYYVYYN